MGRTTAVLLTLALVAPLVSAQGFGDLPEEVRKRLDVSIQTLVVELDLDAAVSEAVVWRRGEGYRRNVMTRVANGGPVSLLNRRPLFFVIKSATKPTLAYSASGANPISLKVEDLGPASGTKAPKYYICHAAFLRADECTFVAAQGDRTFTLAIKPPAQQDYTSEFGVVTVLRPGKKYAFGIDKSMITLGKSQTLTLDVVTVFGATADEDASLGGAISYNTLIGSNSIEGYRGVFGFPIRIKFTFGLEGLDLSRVNQSKGIFFGIGFSVPTGPGG
jgi:hypothetical protein